MKKFKTVLQLCGKSQYILASRFANSNSYPNNGRSNNFEVPLAGRALVIDKAHIYSFFNDQISVHNEEPAKWQAPLLWPDFDHDNIKTITGK